MGLSLVLIGGEVINVGEEIQNTMAGGFWGLVSDTGFVSAYIGAGTQGGVAETYHLDDLVYSQIPEPNSAAMIGLVGCIGVVVRRRFMI